MRHSHRHSVWRRIERFDVVGALLVAGLVALVLAVVWSSFAVTP